MVYLERIDQLFILFWLGRKSQHRNSRGYQLVTWQKMKLKIEVIVTKYMETAKHSSQKVGNERDRLTDWERESSVDMSFICMTLIIVHISVEKVKIVNFPLFNLHSCRWKQVAGIWSQLSAQMTIGFLDSIILALQK